VIVQPNINELAENGICTIAKSKENYPRTSFILNFDYYINQGLLDGAVLNRDLYDSTSLGYYYNLNKLNIEYEEITDLLANYKTTKIDQESLLETYIAGEDAAAAEKQKIENDIRSLAGSLSGPDYFWIDVNYFIQENPNHETLKTLVNSYNLAENQR
jgi:hypothetical protein